MGRSGHLADLAVPDPVANLLHAFARRTLVTHLSGDALLGGQLGQQTRLVNRVGKGLLAVDVLAQLHRGARYQSVSVVGGTADNGVDLVADLVVHLAPVPETLSLRVAVESALGIVPVGIAESHDVLVRYVAQHGCASSADADTGDVQLVRRSFVPECRSHYVAGNHGHGCQTRRRGLQKVSS